MADEEEFTCHENFRKQVKWECVVCSGPTLVDDIGP